MIPRSAISTLTTPRILSLSMSVSSLLGFILQIKMDQEETNRDRFDLLKQKTFPVVNVLCKIENGAQVCAGGVDDARVQGQLDELGMSRGPFCLVTPLICDIHLEEHFCSFRYRRDFIAHI